MRKTCGVWIFLLWLVCSFAALCAQTQSANPPAPTTISAYPKTPLEFFARARQLSDLEAAGIPFHLKATYVASGDTEFTGNGTYEELWLSKDTWRVMAALGAIRYVAIENGGHPSIYATSSYIPLRLRQAIKMLPIQFPTLAHASGDWQLQHRKLSGTDFTVLSKQYPPAQKATGALTHAQFSEQYFFNPRGLMQVHVEDTTVTVYNSFQIFQTVIVPHKISISDEISPLLTMTVETLEPLGTDPKVAEVAAVPGDLQLILPRTNASPGFMRARMIKAPAPEYPLSAKQHGVQGKVVMEAVIDSSGNVREPYVTQSAGQVLDTAALHAVRQWKYSPSIVNGKPVVINTMITVIFQMNY